MQERRLRAVVGCGGHQGAELLVVAVSLVGGAPAVCTDHVRCGLSRTGGGAVYECLPRAGRPEHLLRAFCKWRGRFSCSL